MTDLEQSLIANIPQFSPDEREFMAAIHERVLVVGRSRYTPWVEQADERKLPRERDEEIFDAVIYAAMLVVRKRRERRERLRCFVADEHFKRADGALNEFALAVGTPLIAEDRACTDCLAPEGLSHREGCAMEVLR